jgi:hypothetical protein
VVLLALLGAPAKEEVVAEEGVAVLLEKLVMTKCRAVLSIVLAGPVDFMVAVLVLVILLIHQGEEQSELFGPVTLDYSHQLTRVICNATVYPN